jgi:hypothetical protein
MPAELSFLLANFRFKSIFPFVPFIQQYFLFAFWQVREFFVRLASFVRTKNPPYSKKAVRWEEDNLKEITFD